MQNAASLFINKLDWTLTKANEDGLQTIVIQERYPVRMYGNSLI